MARMFIKGEIGWWYSEWDKEALFYAPKEDMEIFIDSPGGSVYDGFSIAALLRNHAAENGAKVKTCGLGLVASIATVILMSGTDVEMDEDCTLLIHNPRASGWDGTADELRQVADQADTATEQLINRYVKQIKKNGKLIEGDEEKTRKQLQKWMDSEKTFTAKQAVEAGLVDRIANFKEQKQEMQNIPIPAPQIEVIGVMVNKFKTLSNSIKNKYTMSLDKENVEMTKEEKSLWAKFKSFFTGNAPEVKAETTVSESDAKAALEKLGYSVEKKTEATTDAPAPVATDEAVQAVEAKYKQQLQDAQKNKEEAEKARIAAEKAKADAEAEVAKLQAQATGKPEVKTPVNKKMTPNEIVNNTWDQIRNRLNLEGK